MSSVLIFPMDKTPNDTVIVSAFSGRKIFKNLKSSKQITKQSKRNDN